MTGTSSSLYPYRVYTNILYDLFPYHKQLPSSSSLSVFYVGDRRPSFHPARAIAVDELVTHCSSHFTIFDRTNNNKDWLNLLNSNNGLYLYAGINAQLSNHMIYPLLMGIPLLVDHETANNPYWRSYLVDGSTCIVFDKIKAYNLPDLLSLISTKQLKNISLNARILSSGLFSLAQSEQIYGISQVDRFDSVHTQIIDLFRQSLSMIPSDSYDVIVNICDIVQELNRLARFTIPIHIQTDSPLYSFLYQLSTIYSSIRIESFADSIGSSYLLCQVDLSLYPLPFVSAAIFR